MDLWIVVTISAAFFQTLRFMLQKVLSMGGLSATGATFARFLYALPAAALVTGLYILATGQRWPEMGAGFWPYAVTGGLGQILATVCVIAIFKQRNFAVGITFKKTEVIQTALVGLVLLGERISPAGWGAILIGLVGVLLLSEMPGAGGSWLRRFGNRTVVLGLASGFFFAFSAVGYRGASLTVASEDPVLRASVTLLCVLLFQVAAMALWLRGAEKGQISAVWGTRRMAVWLGLVSMAGSLSWFIAFTLQTAAYVQAMGQIELVFSILVSVLFFKERVTMRELAGIGFLGLSILVLVLVL
ncbi:DMT family transporter [Salipiger sp. P9]|uniref:DMT family transporter n=1 Tax=Salipiger pentaromativorans TaxID=2943193 RepID=UPI002158A02A|nr:DMT family transporter [Salipiger pentaromativorans]MCR8548001.1 DMT family transporter [Salipiger pentaromativorans]